MLTFAALVLVVFTGPDGQKIEVNPEQVVSIRNRRPDSIKAGYVQGDLRCSLHTTDGKIVNVIETCEEVRRALEGK
jgi:hypothetical protein